MDFKKSLAKMKKELKDMGEPDPEKHNIDCGNTDCFLCAYHDSLPAYEATVAALFLGHDLAITTPEVRLHSLNKHFCMIHITLFYEFMKSEKRESFGR
jgi:hypothetical protein